MIKTILNRVKQFKLTNKLTAILCCLILGASFLGVQINKQNSLETQKRMEINQKNREIALDLAEKKQAREDKAKVKQLLNWCLRDAETIYWDYIKLNGTLVDEEAGTYEALQYYWDEAAKKQKTAEDVCFKKYK